MRLTRKALEDRVYRMSDFTDDGAQEYPDLDRGTNDGGDDDGFDGGGGGGTGP